MEQKTKRPTPIKGSNPHERNPGGSFFFLFSGVGKTGSSPLPRDKNLNRSGSPSLMSRLSIPGYDAKAKILADRYESVRFADVHDWLLGLLPGTGGSALDVGAGSGRDAKGLVDRGYCVLAVEPSDRMRDEGRRRHPDPEIEWLDDALPDLASLFGQKRTFDLILVSAVWMHLIPEDRPRAFRTLVSCLKPGGILAITIRQGPPDTDRPMFEASGDELEHLAKAHAAKILYDKSEPDQLGRSDVTWSHVAFRLPHDQTKALPVI